MPLASTTALLSNDSLGASLANFHEDLVPSLNSKTGRGSGMVACASGAGDWGSLDGLCLTRSGDGVDLGGSVSSSLDFVGEPTKLTDSGDEFAAYKLRDNTVIADGK